jgi:hypothetical protein
MQKVTSEILEQIIDRYQRGEHIFALADTYNVSVSNIYRLLKENDIPLHGGIKKEVDEERIVTRYKNNISLRMISNEFDIPVYRVKAILLAHGVKIRLGGNNRKQV